MDKVVIDVRSKESTCGFTHVALTRVKRMGGLVFCPVFDLSQLQKLGKDAISNRRASASKMLSLTNWQSHSHSTSASVPPTKFTASAVVTNDFLQLDTLFPEVPFSKVKRSPEVFFIYLSLYLHLFDLLAAWLFRSKGCIHSCCKLGTPRKLVMAYNNFGGPWYATYFFFSTCVIWKLFTRRHCYISKTVSCINLPLGYPSKVATNEKDPKEVAPGKSCYRSSFLFEHGLTSVSVSSNAN